MQSGAPGGTNFSGLTFALAALLAVTCTARAQVLIDDNMEGYPTATGTSVLPHAANPDPAYWESVVFAGSGSVTATGGVTGASGSRASVMSADFQAASSYAGSILNSHAYSVAATQGGALKDFPYSIDLRGSQAAAVTVEFLSVDAAFANTGSIAKTFTLTAANTDQTFSGNLGEPGWAPDSSKVGGASLDLHAPYYSWSVLIHAENPNGWGFDTGNVINFDNVKLTANPPSGVTYLPVTYDANGFFHLNSGQSAYVGYTPDTYSDSNPISLFVWMHGCGGNAEGDMYSIAPPSSRQTQSYIAISIGGRDGDCWSLGTDTSKVLAAITDVARYFNINPRKIYLGGYSSGGDMTYRIGFEHTSLFAGLLVENSDPFRDTGATQDQLLASATWKINVAHLAHLSDTTYPIADVRTSLATLSANGFPVTKIEKDGTHYDADNGAFGTNYDLIHSLLPFLDAGWESPDVGPDLVLTGNAPLPLAGKNFSLTLTVKNKSSTDAENVVIEVTLPAGVAFVSAKPAPAQQAGQILAFNLGKLAKKKSAKVSLTGTAPATVSTVLAFHCGARQQATDPTPDDNVLDLASIVFPSERTSYAGLVNPGGPVNQTGLFHFTVTKANSFSAWILFNGKVFSFTGKLAPDGSFTRTRTVRDIGQVTLDIATLAADGVTGAFTIEGAPFALDGTRAEAFTNANPAPQAGKYTVLFDPTETTADVPQGIGYATMAVTAKGRVTGAGALADGMKVTFASAVNTDGSFPFFASLYHKRGLVGGVVTFSDQAGKSDADGLLAWTNPTAFDTGVTFRASLHAPESNEYILPGLATTNGAATAAFAGFNKPITIGLDDKVSVGPPADPEKFKLKLSRKTGLVTGSFTPVGGNKTRLTGVLHRKSDRSGGFFLDTSGGGSLLVTPTP